MKNSNQIKSINDIIDNQINILLWNKTKFTTVFKVTAFQSIKNILIKEPNDFINYLVNNSRKGNYQNKLFKEYINIIENKLPIYFKKNNKNIVINNLLDPDLNLFNGLSTFSTNVNNNIIKNKTNEIYIGNRKSFYIKPYYIGKLLSIKNDNNLDLIDSVIDFSFEKIKTKNLPDDTTVIVTHLSVIPHYQIGAMLYINKARKVIINEFNKNIKS